MKRALNLLPLLIFAPAAVLLPVGIRLSTADAAASPAFIDVTDTAGISYLGDTYGLAWGDFDGDGYLDLFAGNHQGTPALYRNNGDGTFSDVLDGSGIGPRGDRHDSSFVDYDNDGDLDLYITIGAKGGTGEGPNQLYQNDGQGQFTNVAEEAGVQDNLGRGRGAAWADYDNDGDLDLFIANAFSENAPNAFFRNNGDGTFENIGAEVNLAQYISSFGAAWADYDGDGDPDLYVTGDENKLYRNDGFVFVDVTSAAGVEADLGAAPTWGDYDNDGDLDLYVSSGVRTGVKDYYTWSSHVITFVTGIRPSDEDGLNFTTPAGISVTFHLQEYKNVPIQDPEIIFLGPDGHHPTENPFTLSDEVSGPPPYEPSQDEGFFVWQPAPGVWRIRWTAPDLSINPYFSGLITTSHPISNVTAVKFEYPPGSSLPDHLFRNEGDGTFVDVTATAGLTCELDSRGAAWGDYDNDGDLDLFLVVAGGVSGNEPDRLYRNNGDGTFTDVAALEGVTGSSGGRGWSAMWADYDNDGFLDLYINHRSIVWPIPPGSHQLFHNQGNDNHWLKLRLIGSYSNRDGLGTKVWVTAGGQTQFRELHDESSHFAHYNGPLHIGLGANAMADEVRIEWPSGITQVLTDVQANQLLTLNEPLQPLFVAPNGSDTNDCSSPDSACRTIQQAVDMTAEGGVIKVAAGVYTDSDTPRVGYVVALTKTITLRGGYDATFANLPDPVANPTILDAQGQGRVIYIAGDIGSTIEGLHIIGGNATGLGGGGDGKDAGGGVYVISATITVHDSWLSGNTAELGGGMFLRGSNATLGGNTVVSNSASIGGGGLFLVTSDAALSGNTVISNTSAFGGGLLLQSSTATLSGNTLLFNNVAQLGGGLFMEGCDATLSGNTVASNTASVGGGGLFLTTSEATLGENTVTSNTAAFGGGIQIVESVVTLTKNVVNGNTAKERGGGVFLGSSGNATLNGNTVTHNVADAGGGLFLRASAATLSENVIEYNTVNQSGGGLYLREGSNAELVNNIIADNQADVAGSGLYVAGSSSRLLHTTIARNSGGQSTGVYVDEDASGNTSVVTLTNNILVSHTIGIYVTTGNTATLTVTLWGSGAWANNNPFEGPGTIVSTRNYEGDPAFVDPDAGDYHIGFNSAAIDTGANVGITVDIDGEVRPVGTGYDIGADEYPYQPHCLYLPLVYKQ